MQIPLRALTAAALSLLPVTAPAGDYCQMTDFRSCVREIVRVDAILKERTESGYAGNIGNSLVGCYVECIRLHFPSDSRTACAGTSERLTKAAALARKFAKGYAAKSIRHDCGQR